MIKILLFRGEGFIARAIRWQTRSEYAHVAIEVNGRMYESQAPGGVKVRVPSGDYDEFHLIPDVNPVTAAKVEAFLRSKLGMPYDYMMVARFLSRRPAKVNGKYFCSELVLDALAHAGIDLLHIEAHHASPRDVSISPLLYKHNNEGRRKGE